MITFFPLLRSRNGLRKIALRAPCSLNCLTGQHGFLPQLLISSPCTVLHEPDERCVVWANKDA